MWVVLAFLVIPLYLFVVGRLWDQAECKYDGFQSQLNYVLGCLTALTVGYLFVLLVIRVLICTLFSS